ncbi:MAG TPA: high-potential iron-sulfur protein [Steroidobacteraceae bacterium]|nr:high-potential iron-sulfur protein [Steroidobacteraceae bacterium]
MASKTFDPSRRRLFRQGAVIAGGAALGGLMLKVKAPAQGGKVAKSTAKYQDKPNGTQQCDGCVQFIPGKTPSADGTCKIVEGSISPKGWCMFFSPKG